MRTSVNARPVQWIDFLIRRFTEPGEEATMDEEVATAAAKFFAELYDAANQSGHKAKANSQLPVLSTEQEQLLVELLQVLIIEKKYHSQRIIAAMEDLVTATFRSSWTLETSLNGTVASVIRRGQLSISCYSRSSAARECVPVRHSKNHHLDFDQLSVHVPRGVLARQRTSEFATSATAN